MSSSMLGPTKWKTWLRAFEKGDEYGRVQLPGKLAMLTGQDTRALEAIAACWVLYFASDAEGQLLALNAVRSLLGAMQPKCRPFARELIAWAGDWGDRDKLWPMVSRDVLGGA